MIIDINKLSTKLTYKKVNSDKEVDLLIENFRVWRETVEKE